MGSFVKNLPFLGRDIDDNDDFIIAYDKALLDKQLLRVKASELKRYAGGLEMEMSVNQKSFHSSWLDQLEKHLSVNFRQKPGLRAEMPNRSRMSKWMDGGVNSRQDPPKWEPIDSGPGGVVDQLLAHYDTTLKQFWFNDKGAPIHRGDRIALSFPNPLKYSRIFIPSGYGNQDVTLQAKIRTTVWNNVTGTTFQKEENQREAPWVVPGSHFPVGGLSYDITPAWGTVDYFFYFPIPTYGGVPALISLEIMAWGTSAGGPGYLTIWWEQFSSRMSYWNDLSP